MKQQSVLMTRFTVPALTVYIGLCTTCFRKYTLRGALHNALQHTQGSGHNACYTPDNAREVISGCFIVCVKLLLLVRPCIRLYMGDVPGTMVACPVLSQTCCGHTVNSQSHWGQEHVLVLIPDMHTASCCMCVMC